MSKFIARLIDSTGQVIETREVTEREWDALTAPDGCLWSDITREEDAIADVVEQLGDHTDVSE